METLERSNISSSTVQLIGSHGQTVWHEVYEDNGRTKVAGTMQIGESAMISKITGITTISDFRVGDIAHGGNGAPLMSTFDEYILRPKTGKWRAIQNIGGIGNVTFLPPKDQKNCSPLAFDTGPGNVLIDWSTQQLTKGEKKYDENGLIALHGKINLQLLQEMKKMPYFQKQPPKSTGRELFTNSLGFQWKKMGDELEQEQNQKDMKWEDFIATVTELTAWSIADAYCRFSPSPIGEVYISGGGSRNNFLMTRIEVNLKDMGNTNVIVRNHDSLGFNSDAKEGILFAVLAYATFQGIESNVPSCTGAEKKVILGKITPGSNFVQLFKN